MKKILIIFLLSSLGFFVLTTSAYAQAISSGATYTYKIDDTKAVDGDILTMSDKGLVRANTPYTGSIFGVVQNDAVIIIELLDEGGQPVARSGIAKVNVTNANGPIKKGGLIAVSTTPGKGQRADKAGYVLGTALADMNEATGQIPVALEIKSYDLSTTLNSATANRFLKSLDGILLASTEDPEKLSQLVRYVAAAIIVLGAFAISFFTFSKSMANSVEAIGRNPLAKNFIFSSLVINIVITVVVLGVALAAAFILIKF